MAAPLDELEQMQRMLREKRRQIVHSIVTASPEARDSTLLDIQSAMEAVQRAIEDESRLAVG